MSLAVSLGAAACATILGFDDDLRLDPGGTDGGVDARVDGGPRLCAIDAQFTVISGPLFDDVPPGGIRPDRQGISLSDDETHIYFGLDKDPPVEAGPDAAGLDASAPRGYNWKLVMATRGADGKFGDLHELDGPLNGFYSQRHSTFDHNETLILFAAADAGWEQLVYATRDAATQPFAPPRPLPALINEGPFYDYDPFLYVLPDGGKELWYVHGYNGGAALRHARILNDDLSATESFTKPEQINPTEDTEVTPVLSADGLELYFSREEGKPGLPNANIWRSIRTTIDESFENNRQEVLKLNSGVLDRPGWLSTDGCRLYFLSSRGNTEGRMNIYVADRSKPSP